MKVQRFTRVIINVALTLIGYGKPPKLDYCFITSTSVVPVAVSIHHWAKKEDKNSQQHTLDFSGTHTAKTK